MKQLKSLFLACWILLLCCAAQAADGKLSLLFIATGNVPAGKFHQLADIARPHGITLEIRYLNQLPENADAGLWEGHDAVFVDSYLTDAVQLRLAAALPGLRQPIVWLYGKEQAASGIPAPLAQRLRTYYVNGGRQNFTGFFATVAAHLRGKPAEGIAEPIVFPKAAVYHPRAPGLVFADSAAYLRWIFKEKGRSAASSARPPVIGIALHQQYIAAMQTEFIDDLIRRIEAAGAVALPFYTPMLDADGFTRLLRPGGAQGETLADVLITTQIMLNPEERRREFEELGIPVLQAMSWRRGDEAQWAESRQGVTLMDVPFYLAQPEYAGVTDIQVAAATRKGDEQVVPIAAQARAVVDKALRMVALQRKPRADKRLAVMFWNYPPGEKNLSASFLNLPRSLQSTLSSLSAAGYSTQAPEEEPLIRLLQRLLAPTYRSGQLQPLLDDGLADRMPVASYRQWLATLPQATQDELRAAWGEPEQSAMVVREGGTAYFVIPRLLLGHVAVLPQPPRTERWDPRAKALYHSSTAMPSHHYLAVYLWARQQWRADALVHYGTHGTQEWLPGKERGLSVYDPPMLAVGDLPVAYPYIADNIGEAMQAKRRGRAVTITHQTPPFAPGGLHEALTHIHDLLHQWLAQDEGAVKERIFTDLLDAARRERLLADMGWSEPRARESTREFVDALHAQLHELAETAQPQGLHTLGRAPEELHRLGTVLLMLGREFWQEAARHAGVPQGDLDEALVGPWTRLPDTEPYRLLQRHVVAGESADDLPPALRDAIARARKAYDNLGAQQENAALITFLDGRHLATSYGGDPIKNPDAYPTGRNLYGFDPSRVPTRQAWEAGKQSAEQMLAEHRRLHGRQPSKLTFSLWSVETMRHQGQLEAQALWLLGVEPVWDDGGRVTGVRLVPREELGRPRVDVVLSATGLYRDHFPNTLKQLAQAVLLASRAQEEDNPVAANARAITGRLLAQGVPGKAAEAAGATRIFSSESGRYGTGLDDAVLDTGAWKGKAEGDRKLAELYLSRMQYAYGPDEQQWGEPGVDGARNVNLYAEQLRGTEGAVLSRSSNLYGMLTTDDPFQYLGGISLAVRHLDGKAPELYISNLRGQGAGRVEGAAQFLAKELATRQFHPGYIQGLMKEGYAGTLQVLDATNNFWGWTATAREVVRDDQWQEMADVYVRDKHHLGLREWFERHNPHALAQSIERMLEAARQGYWQADEATVSELKERWQDLARRHDVRSDNAAFAAMVGARTLPGAGFGIAAPGAAAPKATAQLPQTLFPPATPPAPKAPDTPPPEAQQPQPPEAPLSGLLLQPTAPEPPPAHPAAARWLLALLGALALAGAWGQHRRFRATA